MLTLYGGYDRNCAGISRRRMLQVGGAGLFGLSLPRILAAEATASENALEPRAKSVIFLFLFGGPSQLETFDPKPEAPDAIRGPFSSIETRTPGLRVGEHLPRVAAISDRLAVIRTMTHDYNDHSTAGHYIQTGHPWAVPIGQGFNATDNDWPAMGSVVEYVDQRAAGGPTREVPSYVYVPNRCGHLQTYSSKLDRPGQYAGWLGRGYDALATDIRKRDDQDNPYFRDCTDEELDYRIKGVTDDEGLTLDRLRRRESLLSQFDAERHRVDRRGTAAVFDQFQQRAFSLVTSEKTRMALDVRNESADVRDRYGRHLFGQSTLVARRMVEAGARFVTVCWDAPDGYSWDSHLNSNDVRDYLIPGLDQSLSALVEDLEQRGRLDDTLVVCVGEMGRTPQANANAGRGHWSMLFPAVLAGGGIQGGVVHGRSDKDAGAVVENPVRPEDLAATIYTALGIDPEMRVSDPQGRPVPVVDGGRPLTELFA